MPTLPVAEGNPLGQEFISKPFPAGHQPTSGVANSPGWGSTKWEGHPVFARASCCPSNVCQGGARLPDFIKASSTLPASCRRSPLEKMGFAVPSPI